MPRKRLVKRKEILPDPKYDNKVIAKFINHLMVDGKKSIAESIVYGAIEVLAERIKKQPLKKEDQVGGESGEGGVGASALTPPALLERALENVRPVVEVRSRRVGGATYQVPVEIREARQNTLAMRWIIQSARDRSEKGMTSRLANELLDAISGKGVSVKKREDTHKMARANQAFAHFRWT